MTVRSRSDGLDLITSATGRNPSRRPVHGGDALGITRSDETRREGGRGSLPQEATRRGASDGEVEGSGVSCSSWDCSSEKKTAAGGFGRPPIRRSGARVKTRRCQNGVQDKGKAKGREKEVRGRRCSPGTEKLAGGSSGWSSSIPSGLRALGSGFWGERGATEGASYRRKQGKDPWP